MKSEFSSKTKRSLFLIHTKNPKQSSISNFQNLRDLNSKFQSQRSKLIFNRRLSYLSKLKLRNAF